MGKRTGFSGLSRFIQNAFKDANSNQEVSANAAKPETSHWVEGYNATGLVTHFTDESQVPEHLRKLHALLLSILDTSRMPSRRGRCDTILDPFCGVGGNAIAFAKTCQRVIALDNSPTRLALARHNAQIYKVAHHIEFILADYVSFAKTYLAMPKIAPSRKIDVVFLSPPWGGPSYLTSSPSNPSGVDDDEHPSYSLSSIQPIHGAELFRLTRQITPNIAYYLPRNTDLDEISALADDGRQADAAEYIEVEEEWTGSKLKALTCYFGGLVEGQEALFEGV